MADLTFSASPADLNRLNDAICALNGYKPGTQTKAQFARAWQIREWRRLIVQAERQAAIAVAVATVAEPTRPVIT